MYSNGRGVIKSNKRSKMNHLYIETSYWSMKLGFMLCNRWGRNIFTFFSPPPTVLTMALPFSLTPHLPLTSVLHSADGKNGEKRAGKPRFPQERKKNDDERKEKRGDREVSLGLEEYWKLWVERKWDLLEGTSSVHEEYFKRGNDWDKYFKFCYILGMFFANSLDWEIFFKLCLCCWYGFS